MTDAPAPPSSFARLVLALGALGFLGFGLAFYARPVPLGEYVQLGVGSPVAIVEVRAMYGGLELGIGVLLAACVLRPGWCQLGLLAAALCLGGLGGGRASAMLLGGVGDVHRGLVAFELSGATLAAATFLWERRRRARVST